MRADDKAVFGVDLTENVQRCGVRFRGAEGHVPLFCRDVFDYLSREGRWPGRTPARSRTGPGTDVGARRRVRFGPEGRRDVC